MWYFALLTVTAGLGVSLAAIGSAYGLGKSVKSSVESMARQPEAAGDIQTLFIIGGGLIEALTIYALVMGIILWTSLPAPSAFVEVLPNLAG